MSEPKRDTRTWFLNKLQEIAAKGDTLTKKFERKDISSEELLKATVEGLSVSRDLILTCAMYISEIEESKAIDIIANVEFGNAMGTLGKGAADLRDFVMKMAVLQS